jgi:hypothetical protein
LFEVFETSGDAVRSFYRFLPNAMKNVPVLVPKTDDSMPVNGDTASPDSTQIAA